MRISRASLRVLAGYAETFAPNGPIGRWRGGEADAAGIERRVVQPRCRGTGASGHVIGIGGRFVAEPERRVQDVRSRPSNPVTKDGDREDSIRDVEQVAEVLNAAACRDSGAEPSRRHEELAGDRTRRRLRIEAFEHFRQRRGVGPLPNHRLRALHATLTEDGVSNLMRDGKAFDGGREIDDPDQSQRLIVGGANGGAEVGVALDS